MQKGPSYGKTNLVIMKFLFPDPQGQGTKEKNVKKEKGKGHENEVPCPILESTNFFTGYVGILNLYDSSILLIRL